MAASICIIVRKAPYGSMDAAEAVRHINGALAAGLKTCAVLLGDGAYLAVRDQRAGEAGWTSLSEALGQSLSSGAQLRDGPVNRPDVLVGESALLGCGIGPDRLLPGVRVVSDGEAAAAIASADSFLLF
jgi:hypothetical protein